MVYIMYTVYEYIWKSAVQMWHIHGVWIEKADLKKKRFHAIIEYVKYIFTVMI